MSEKEKIGRQNGVRGKKDAHFRLDPKNDEFIEKVSAEEYVSKAVVVNRIIREARLKCSSQNISGITAVPLP